MKIYLVEGSICLDPFHPLKAFKTKELAERFIEKLEEDNPDGECYTITTLEYVEE